MKDQILTKFNQIRDRYGGIIYIGAILMLLSITYWLFAYGVDFAKNPCAHCEELGYQCIKNYIMNGGG